MLLTDSIEKVSGIGSIRSKALKEFGVQTAFDLLRIAPKRYEDRTNLLPLSSLFERKLPFAGLFQAKLISRTIKHIRRNMCIVSAVFSDSGSKSVQARWFNQPYLFKNLKESETYYLFGEVVEFGGKPQFENPEIERINDEETSPNASGCLTPIYPSSKVLSKAKLSPRLLRKIICGLFQTIDWQASFPNFDGPFP
ncbi:hypothetical protein HYY75_00445 [bacterium]|nr:hypothetical protein [bacterium]